MVKVSKLVPRKLIRYRSNIGSGAFRRIKYFRDIPRQLFCVFHHKVKIPQKHVCVLFIHNINPTAEKSSKNSFKMTHESNGSGRSSLTNGILNSTKNVKRMLIQQFWRIFQVKYLSNDSSNQYGSQRCFGLVL